MDGIHATAGKSFSHVKGQSVCVCLFVCMWRGWVVWGFRQKQNNSQTYGDINIRRKEKKSVRRNSSKYIETCKITLLHFSSRKVCAPLSAVCSF